MAVLSKKSFLSLYENNFYLYKRMRKKKMIALIIKKLLY